MIKSTLLTVALLTATHSNAQALECYLPQSCVTQETHLIAGVAAVPYAIIEIVCRNAAGKSAIYQHVFYDQDQQSSPHHVIFVESEELVFRCGAL